MRQFEKLACACLALTWGMAASWAEDKPDTPKPLPNQVKMEFKDTALDTVLEQLSDMTGLSIVKEATIEGKITIIQKQYMTVDDAVALLNTVLKEKGYVGIRTGKILKIVKLDEAKKRSIPVHTGADPNKVEANDEVITQVIPIKYVDAVQLKKDFAPLIPSYADLSANSASNNLIVTDTGANIRRLLEIINSIDTQTSTIAEVKVFQLKYASATSAARLLTEIFKTDDANQGRGGQASPFNRFRGFGGGGGGGAGGGGFGGFGGGGGPGGGGAGGGAQQADEAGHKPQKVTASADDRTNSVVVSASADTLVVIEKILKDLDANPSAEQDVFMYRLKNAQSKNLESVLNILFGSSNSGGNRSTTSTTRTNGGPGQNVQRTGTGFGGSSGGGGSSFGSGGGGGGGSSFGSSSSGTATRQGFNSGGGSSGSNALSGDLTGQVFVVADYDTNSLMVMTASKNFDKVKAIINQLDQPVKQVIIRVLIAEVTHEKTSDVGTDSSVLTKGAVNSVLTNFGVASQTTGAIAKLVQGDVSVVLRALETEGKLEVLSRPYIVASDNQPSNITVGQEVPFVVSSRTTDTGQTVNTIQYQDIGIILNVTAHINEDGLVIMDVAPEVSSLTGTTVPISDTLTAPVFAKRSATSRVGVHDGQTVVIGGMMEDKKTDTNQGIPVLRNIPGLGLLFGRRQRDKSKTELLIFLTPHVAHEAAYLKPLSDAEVDALKLVPNAIKPGTFWEHKQGLERGATIISPVDGAGDNGIQIEKSDRIETPEQALQRLREQDGGPPANGAVKRGPTVDFVTPPVQTLPPAPVQPLQPGPQVLPERTQPQARDTILDKKTEPPKVNPPTKAELNEILDRINKDPQTQTPQ